MTKFPLATSPHLAARTQPPAPGQAGSGAPSAFTRAPFLPLFALLASLALCACGPDPESALKAHRIQADPDRTLGQIMESYPYFSKVLWTSYYLPDGVSRARTSGMLDLDGLVRKTSGIRVFSARERAALDKAGASLSFSMEFGLPKGGGEPVLTRMSMRIVAMGWDKEAVLPNGDIFREIMAGKAGDAMMKAVLDAADYCRDRPASQPGRN